MQGVQPGIQRGPVADELVPVSGPGCSVFAVDKLRRDRRPMDPILSL